MGGEKFVHHHIHATRHMPAKGRGVAPRLRTIAQTNRSHLMVHVFMYHSGVTAKLGPARTAGIAQENHE